MISVLAIFVCAQIIFRNGDWFDTLIWEEFGGGQETR